MFLRAMMPNCWASSLLVVATFPHYFLCWWLPLFPTIFSVGGRLFSPLNYHVFTMCTGLSLWHAQTMWFVFWYEQPGLQWACHIKHNIKMILLQRKSWKIVSHMAMFVHSSLCGGAAVSGYSHYFFFVENDTDSTNLVKITPFSFLFLFENFEWIVTVSYIYMFTLLKYLESERLKSEVSQRTTEAWLFFVKVYFVIFLELCFISYLINKYRNSLINVSCLKEIVNREIIKKCMGNKSSVKCIGVTK